MELALFGSLFLENSGIFNLHRTRDETDFTAFLHQASYPPVVVKFLHRILRDLEHLLLLIISLISISITVWKMISKATHLFDMEEVFSLKGDGHAWHGDIIIVTRAVVDICANSKCNWFGLPGRTKEGDKWKCQIVHKIKMVFK